ncbi:hypothetical protein CLUG_00566 [Clavispora lusitaniae ATCC 42720]|uniref:DUF7702 domain-containing protein n=1 Tax=Clavispora lusitaniae (strain ATCC 42720) TaxID=306902 RepID=C4XX93_CLAL4|nr:uncharacterized protein CLUG_00566 [Clavispora lusitaniae ATCC 42720]EEQ36443.1 hypothetical protein CLUG_00566 [Clavispora lusitaniae ATCC 42720]
MSKNERTKKKKKKKKGLCLRTLKKRTIAVNLIDVYGRKPPLSHLSSQGSILTPRPSFFSPRSLSVSFLMSGFVSTDLGAAASFYLAVYVLFTLFMTTVVIRKGFKTVYTFLLFFGIVRTGGQLCGVAYAKLGPSYYKWLIAYLVLGAEGYFALIFAAFQFICKAQKQEFGSSWLVTSGPPIKSLLLGRNPTWKSTFRHFLIPANVLVIVGGTMLAGMNTEDLQKDHSTVNTSKGLRTAGQAMFVSMTIVVELLNIYVYFKERVRNSLTLGVMGASPFLLVRGVFGILSIYVTSMNYFDTSNYNGGSASHKLTIYEYVLSTTMEFVASCCLTATLWFDREGKPEFEEWPLTTKTSELEKNA